MLSPSAHPLLQSLQTPERGKIVSAAEAVRLIRDGDTIATGGFVGIGFAEEIAIALEALFLERANEYPQAPGKPSNLTLVYAGGQGDGKEKGPRYSPRSNGSSVPPCSAPRPTRV